MNAPLKRAIVLRMAVRSALDADDLPEVCRLNRLADIAYDDIKYGHHIYSDWAFGRLTDEQVGAVLQPNEGHS